MKAFARHFSFEFLGGLRNRSLLLMNYLLPLGFYALMGAMMSEINPFFSQLIVPAMVTFAVLSSAILGLPAPLVEAREAEILRSFRINGVSARRLLAVPALSTSVHIVIAGAIIVATAPILFRGPLPLHWPAFILVFFAFLLACTGLGSLIGVVAGTSRSAILWQQLIYLPSMLLGGLMVPGHMLPELFVRIGHILPATYAMDAFLGLAYGQEILYSPMLAVAILTAGGVLAFVLAAWLFAWDSRSLQRRPVLSAALALLPYLAGALFLV
ncbi:MAG: ABC transporter permease [Bacillota bacterium]|jgi:ABC-2 type transport system permease protein